MPYLKNTTGQNVISTFIWWAEIQEFGFKTSKENSTEMTISDLKYTPPLEIVRIIQSSHVHRFFKNAVYVIFI